MARLAQTHVDPKHRPVDIDAVVRELWLGQIAIGYMHVVHPSGKRILGINAVAHTGADVVCESEVLSLRKLKS